MGYRLEGDSVAPINQADIISEPVALGSVQVPNDGQPIILLNDKQTYRVVIPKLQLYANLICQS